MEFVIASSFENLLTIYEFNHTNNVKLTHLNSFQLPALAMNVYLNYIDDNNIKDIIACC